MNRIILHFRILFNGCLFHTLSTLRLAEIISQFDFRDMIGHSWILYQFSAGTLTIQNENVRRVIKQMQM